MTKIEFSNEVSIKPVIMFSAGVQHGTAKVLYYIDVVGVKLLISVDEYVDEDSPQVGYMLGVTYLVAEILTNKEEVLEDIGYNLRYKHAKEYVEINTKWAYEFL
jgi:hypothetical protein